MAPSKRLLPDDARMDAYYYGFDRTGVDLVDAILSAVAIAGKGAHHTESWNDLNPDYYNGRQGLAEGDGTAVGLIQANAERAAKEMQHWRNRAIEAEQTPHLPEDIRVTFSWACPACGEWSHGYGSNSLAAQELLEHQDERHG